ncbi:hypothetical protein CDAR_403551, partial [Caerostris darwini]
TDQERHWDVKSIAGTDVRYASRNASVQKEKFDFFNSSQGIIFPATEYFANSDCTSGAENPAMAFSIATSTSTLNPFEQTCPNISVLMQHHPNLSFYNQLPPNCPGPSNDLTLYESTNKNYNISMNMESRQSGIPNFELALFQEYDAVAVARKSDRTQKNTSCVSYLNGTSLDVQYHGNPCTGKSSHTAALQHESTNTN